MKETKIRLWYSLLYVILIIIVIINGIFDYKSQQKEFLHLLKDQAYTTSTAVIHTSQQRIHFSEEIQETYKIRALELLHVVDQMDADGILTVERLSELAEKNSVFQINLYDENGDQLYSWHEMPYSGRGMGRKYGFIRRLQPLFNGEADTLVFGIGRNPERNYRNEDEYKFVVSIRRTLGGAITCHLSVEAEKQFRISTDLSNTLEEMLNVEGISYIILSEMNGGSKVFSKVPMLDSLSVSVIEKYDDDIRLVKINNEKHIEINHELVLKDMSLTLVLGFATDHFDRLKVQIIKQIILRSLFLTVALFLLFFFFISRQNVLLLQYEKVKIEHEVRQLEKLIHLQEKQVAMGELAAGIAHEIRNPLNAIGIQVQRLNRRIQKDRRATKDSELTGTIIHDIGRINKTLEDFLNYAKPTPLKKIQIDISSLISEVVDLFQSSAKKKQVAIHYEQTREIIINADPNYLKQAITNILKNAIEASTSNNKIFVYINENIKNVILTIQDEGIGIKQEDVDRIFDLFYTTKDMGTGIGLAITHKIIADHGGSITLKSKIREGSAFYIDLPKEIV